MKDVESMKAEAMQCAGWTEHLCKKCKAKITEKMKPVAAGYNAGGYKKKWAEAKMAAMSLTLWRDMCPKCIKTLKQKVATK